MRCLLSIVVMIATGLHTVLGCCMHHAHTFARECCQASSTVSTPCRCDTHHLCALAEQDVSNKAEAPSDKDHPSRHECNGPSCNFLRTEQLADDFELQFDAFCVAPLSAVQWSVVPHDVHDARACTKTGLSCASPVRPHLLHQVLLI